MTQKAPDLNDQAETVGELATSGNPALEHAWAWFRYHAEQRVTTMRFYIAAIGGAGAGVGVLNQGEQHFLCASLSLLTSLMAFCFLRMDRRAGELVKAGERALSVEQGKIANTVDNKFLMICASVEKSALSWPGTFGEAI